MDAADFLPDELTDMPALLTVEEAARVLRIGRSLGYELARRYLASNETEGLPVIRFGHACLRVPRWALVELIRTGRVVRLNDPSAHSSLKSRRQRSASTRLASQLTLLESD
jgi:hypothetical protein